MRSHDGQTVLVTGASRRIGLAVAWRCGARAIVRAAGRHDRLVIVDRPWRQLLFRLMAGPRRSRFGPVHGAFEALLRECRPRTAAERPDLGAVAVPPSTVPPPPPPTRAR